MSNLRYRLRETVTILATHEYEIKDRLKWAVTQHFILAFPQNANSLPEYFNTKYKGILDSLTAKELEGVDKVQFTILKMRKKTASIIAKNIFNLYAWSEKFVGSFR